MAAQEERSMSVVRTIKPRNTIPVPGERSGHRCVAEDRNVYVFGGYSPHYSQKIFRELWCFHTSTCCWSLLDTTGPFPASVCSSCVVLNKGNLIVYGGSGIPFGQSNSSKLHMCLLGKKKWFEVVANSTTSENNNSDSESESDDEADHRLLGAVLDRKPKLPIPGYGQSMVLSPDQQLYVFAGTTGNMFNCYLSKFCFKTKDWKFVKTDNKDVPFPRYRHEAVHYKDRFFIIGGGMGSTDPEDFFNLDKVHSFHYASTSWQLHNCLPSGQHGFPPRRRCHGCVLYNNSVYITGGYDGITLYDDIWSLDLDTLQWTKFPKVLPYPVYFHSAAVTSAGCMYIFGGVRSLQADTDSRSNEMHQIWLTLPPLLDLSIQVLMDNIADVDEMTVKDFAELGIPPHLVA